MALVTLVSYGLWMYGLMATFVRRVLEKECSMQAKSQQPPCPRDGVAKRVLWLFGAYTLLSQAGFLVAYYLLPGGSLRNSPQAAAAHAAARAGSFAGELALTLAFNLLGVALVAVLMNFNQVRGVPVGYLYPLFLGIFSGLLAGSNSFTNSDLSPYDVRDGTALAYTIGGLEILGYVLMVAATVRYGVYHYRSWWR
jgi:hypothetical protein